MNRLSKWPTMILGYLSNFSVHHHLLVTPMDSNIIKLINQNKNKNKKKSHIFESRWRKSSNVTHCWSFDCPRTWSWSLFTMLWLLLLLMFRWRRISMLLQLLLLMMMMANTFNLIAQSLLLLTIYLAIFVNVWWNQTV